MSEITDRFQEFLSYAKLLKGDEKGEAQVFCDRLFQAFGHKGYKEAGAELEFRIKKKSTKGTSFADLVWKPRMLLEMKKRGENLFHHYQQAFDYWVHAVPNRPRYVVLCNFDEFRIYDFDKQIDEPVDVVALVDLPQRYTALNFLFPNDPDPIFGNDLEEVSREAADKVALLFNSLIKRGVERTQAQRFVLQTVVAMFAEDIGLLPANIVYSLARDCLTKGQSAYDQFGGLFRQMNDKTPAKGGVFRRYPISTAESSPISILLIFSPMNLSSLLEKRGLPQKTGRRSILRSSVRSSSRAWMPKSATPTEHTSHPKPTYCASSDRRLSAHGGSE